MSNNNRITWDQWQAIQEQQRAQATKDIADWREECRRRWSQNNHAAETAAYNAQQAALAPYFEAIEECYEGDLSQLAERLAEVERRFPECPPIKPFQ